MKKILITTSILLFFISFFYACNPSGVKNPQNPEVAIADNCLPKSLAEPMTSDEEGAIDAFLAQRISENYANDPYKGYIYNELSTSILNGTPNGKRTPDSHSAWFDLRKLKSLINTIENSVCDNNCKIPLKLGVRIYFAKYPTVGPNSSENDLKNLPSNYSNMHSVFFVATYDGAKGNHIDFDPMNVGTDKCTPKPFTQLLLDRNNVYKVSSLGSRNIALRDSTVANHGGMCPPPADSSCTFPSDY